MSSRSNPLSSIKKKKREMRDKRINLIPSNFSFIRSPFQNYFIIGKNGVKDAADEEEDNIESNLLNDCASDPRKTFRVNG